MRSPASSVEPTGRQTLAADTPTLVSETAAAGMSDYVYVTVWLSNIGGVTHVGTLRFAGNEARDDMPVSLAAQAGPQKIVDGWLMRRGSSIYAYGDAANVILCKYQAVPYIPPA